ncbi:MAG TPA: hypothetical protein VNN23_08150 [Ornithinibacter sp.]|nr:hypothetical protein [Ornithinibacter sp.]
MGFDRPGQMVHPQQLQISDTLAAPRRTFAIEMPRRTSKSTSIFLVLLGRCAMRPNYKVTYTAQSGVAGMRQFREWASVLEAITPPDDLDLPPWLRGRPRARPKYAQRQVALFGEELTPLEDQEPTGRGFRILRGNVDTGIVFDNGSTFKHIPPKAANFRGAASDVSWIDEAQEIAPENGDELLAGIRPLQDTRPGASIIVSGTAGEVRAGIFWDMLQRGRAGDPDVGILDYAAPAATAWAAIEKLPSAMKILKAVHPGIGTLTTIEQMRAQWAELPRPEWAREYLSLWPETFSQRAITAQLWDDARLPKKLPKPDVITFGLAIRPGGSAAAIVAAWRNGDGVAFLEVVDHRPGTRWIPERIKHLTTTYRRSTVAYDVRDKEATATQREVLRFGVAERLLQKQQWPDISAGAIQFLRELERGTLKHFGQIGLDSAVAAASKRDSGETAQWTWTPMQAGGDIACLDAASRALRNWDTTLDRKPARTRILTARAS